MKHRSGILLLAIAVLFAAGAAMMLFLFNPAQFAFYPACLFRQFTGLNCPGCGSLRATHQLLHGNIGDAIRLNALLVASVPLAIWLAIRLAWQHFKSIPGPVVRPLWIWLYGAVWALYGVLRELPVLLAAWPL